MMKFEARNPFPLTDTFSKSEALLHAEEADSWLGLRVREVEALLASRGSSRPAPSSSGAHQQLWFGLAPRDLQTPYFELRVILHLLISPTAKNFSVVDLGAAYGRMGFVIARHFQRVTFTGYEYVGERVAESRQAIARFGASPERIRMEHADLTSLSFQMPTADLYFIYDYGTPAAIEKTLHDLRKVTRGRDVNVVARGRVCRYAIESRHASWLTKLNPLAPESAFTIYSALHSQTYWPTPDATSEVTSVVAPVVASDSGSLQSV
jgi:hypothetical protein